MAMIKCASCGKEISDKASKCIHCGTTDFLINNNKKIKEEIIKNEEESLSIKELKQELEKAKIENLKKEIELEKKKTPKEKKNHFIIFINIIRYLVAIFFSFGGLVCLFGGKVLLAFGYLFIGIPFYPFIYKLIFKNKNVSKTIKIVSQIIVPIVGFIISMFLMSAGVK